MRHAQADLGERLSLWAGYDPRCVAFVPCPFLGYETDGESHSIRAGLSVGPLYIGAGLFLGWCRAD